MNDTYQGECRICGYELDLIEGICQECQCLYSEFEAWRKKCAMNCEIKSQDKELFVAFLRSKHITSQLFIEIKNDNPIQKNPNVS